MQPTILFLHIIFTGNRHFGKITRHFLPTVSLFAAGISRVVVDVEAPGDESGNF